MIENKSIIIIGPAGSGKSLKAKALARAVAEDGQICIIKGLHRDFEENFFFSSCTKETEIIIIDEVADLNKLEAFFGVKSLLKVNKPYQHSFYVNPKFIIVCAENITKAQIKATSKSFQGKFNVIDLGETVNL